MLKRQPAKNGGFEGGSKKKKKKKKKKRKESRPEQKGEADNMFKIND